MGDKMRVTMTTGDQMKVTEGAQDKSDDDVGGGGDKMTSGGPWGRSSHGQGDHEEEGHGHG